MSYDESDERWDRMHEDMLKSVSQDAVRYHLRTIGDAIEALIKNCVAQAERLIELGFYSPALVAAATAIELIIRFLLVRPLVSGAFLSDEWAAILSEKIGSGRTDEDRRILPELLAQWKINLEKVVLPDGTLLWASLKGNDGLIEKRNEVVHQGAEMTESDARLAVQCVSTMMNEIVYRIAAELGFTHDKTGCWCAIQTDHGYVNRHPAWDPIKGKPFTKPV